ncbi:class I SAM-dependent methyltransferase [Alteraurantiacibacter aestuarii]|uniref:Methyltransferase domain-containing protein n=1 Tax=Alteraurantiacibacter aestuarii TaxID=650004 RepID=A0A844ZLK1_9SPHN|nr:methyltransferase domain-containing protein [Alteraurantiacibacter aestuarii]MXO87727.1 methyltransferase domain-containing protein [Alteraurantiacibacter aestuarii]
MLDKRRLCDELMDDPALDATIYGAVLRDLSQVNRLTLAYRPTLNFLQRAIGDRQSFTLLDVGFGCGDTLRVIARWAKKRGISAHLVGIDLNSRSAGVAREATPADYPIEYRTGDYADLAGENFDIVISNLVAHHMTQQQLLEFLRFMESEARAGWFINDLHRHTLSYVGYPWLARIMRWHPIVRSDGQTSIARSFRPDDWQRLLGDAGITAARIERFFPFRLCVSRTR